MDNQELRLKCLGFILEHGRSIIGYNVDDVIKDADKMYNFVVNKEAE